MSGRILDSDEVVIRTVIREWRGSGEREWQESGKVFELCPSSPHPCQKFLHSARTVSAIFLQRTVCAHPCRHLKNRLSHGIGKVLVQFSQGSRRVRTLVHTVRNLEHTVAHSVYAVRITTSTPAPRLGFFGARLALNDVYHSLAW